MKTIEITEQQAKEMFDSGIPSLKSIAESTYPDLFKNGIEWEDFGIVKGWYVGDNSSIDFFSSTSSLNNKNVFPTSEEAEACLGLSQLCQWRDKYNESWKPDYNDNDLKYQICINKGKPFKQIAFHSSVLTFKTEEIRDKFFKDFTELIKQARFLL